MINSVNLDVKLLINFRLLLHKLSIYDDNGVENLMGYIQDKLDITAHMYSEDTRCVELKVKTSNIKKKNKGFEHRSHFYESIISEAMLSFVCSDWVRNKLKSMTDQEKQVFFEANTVLKGINDIDDYDAFIKTVYDTIVESGSVNNLFAITTVPNNIIYLYI